MPIYDFAISAFSDDLRNWKKAKKVDKIKEIINFKYCSFVIADKEKDMIQKIRKVVE